MDRPSNWRQKAVEIPREELLRPGHPACPGCGAAPSMRMALKALGPKTMVVIPASCWSVIAGAHPNFSLEVPLLHTPFLSGAAAAAGLKAALEAQGDQETLVMAWAGDGGTYDIGFQGLSGAAERRTDMLYVCYDNEAYMNTGGQRSSATPVGTRTGTTPGGKPEEKKDLLNIMVAHGAAYVATATLAYPQDLLAKFRKARRRRGFRFIHLLSPCPTGWGFPEDMTITMARMAVESGAYRLMEWEGKEWYTTHRPSFRVKVEDYLQAQTRFAHLTVQELQEIAKQIATYWEKVSKKE